MKLLNIKQTNSRIPVWPSNQAYDHFKTYSTNYAYLDTQ